MVFHSNNKIKIQLNALGLLDISIKHFGVVTKLRRIIT